VPYALCWLDIRAAVSAESAAVVAYFVDRGESVRPACQAVIAAAIDYYHRSHSLANPAG